MQAHRVVCAGRMAWATIALKTECAWLIEGGPERNPVPQRLKHN